MCKRFISPNVLEYSPQVLFESAGFRWSFGVVLYEIFSTGKTPYSDVGLYSSNEIIPWLEEGHRLEQPDLCPADM